MHCKKAGKIQEIKNECSAIPAVSEWPRWQHKERPLTFLNFFLWVGIFLYWLFSSFLWF